MTTGFGLSRTVAWLAVLFVLVLPGHGHAQSVFERLVMPGDLIQGHADLQSDCSNCHVSFAQQNQAPLCLDCHKKVARDIADDAGYHGRASEVAVQDCRHCHTDHIGRAADIVGLDAETFDHRVTDFALVGAHRAAPCASCHAVEAKFRDAPGQCVDCHSEEEPHLGRLGRDCGSCHKETRWQDLRGYDHAETKFPLEGAHKTVPCSDCHVGEVFTGLPLTCIGCHRIQDVHRGSLGEKCETCHTIAKWTEVRFDHDTDTEFALLGEHANADCTDCHSATDAKGEPGSACIDCHRADDPHRGQLGTGCKNCHQPAGWRQAVAFDHDITQFPLIGLHVLVPCEGCHLDAAYHNAALNCASCHAEDDTHDGTLGTKCEACHNPNGWAFWAFDHDTATDFRLAGKHDGLKCNACHTKTVTNPLRPPQTCGACHTADDIHNGRFGPDCGSCHDTERFKGARLR